MKMDKNNLSEINTFEGYSSIGKSIFGVKYINKEKLKQSGGGVDRRYDFELLAEKSERSATYRFDSCPDYNLIVNNF
jgi:hypothetical protein